MWADDINPVKNERFQQIKNFDLPLGLLWPLQQVCLFGADCGDDFAAVLQGDDGFGQSFGRAENLLLFVACKAHFN